jgi:hypothetical protein
MAFVPDEAIRNADLLSPAAYWLYTIIWAETFRKKGVTSLLPWPKIKAKYPGLTKPTFYRARAELDSKKWIEFKGDIYRPIYGENIFESLKNETHGSLTNGPSGITGNTPSLNHENDSIYSNDSPNDLPNEISQACQEAGCTKPYCLSDHRYETAGG